MKPNESQRILNVYRVLQPFGGDVWLSRGVLVFWGVHVSKVGGALLRGGGVGGVVERLAVALCTRAWGRPNWTNLYKKIMKGFEIHKALHTHPF